VGNGSGTKPRPSGFQFGVARGRNLIGTVLSTVVCGRPEALSGGQLGERTPAEDNTEVHEATTAAPSGGAHLLE
jgi:hypothetical protein